MLRSLPLTVMLLLSGLAGTAALAQDAPAASDPPAVTFDPQGVLAIGGVQIMWLRDKSVNPTMTQRCDRITDRLVKALARIHGKGKFEVESVTVGPPANEPWILIEGEPVMKITYQDVLATRRKPARLAEDYVLMFQQGLRRVYGP